MAKDLIYYMNLPYHEQYDQCAEGGFVGSVRELKGCITQGETLDECKTNLLDAKICWLETELENGHDIPEPQDG